MLVNIACWLTFSSSFVLGVYMVSRSCPSVEAPWCVQSVCDLTVGLYRRGQHRSGLSFTNWSLLHKKGILSIAALIPPSFCQLTHAHDRIHNQSKLSMPLFYKTVQSEVRLMERLSDVHATASTCYIYIDIDLFVNSYGDQHISVTLCTLSSHLNEYLCHCLLNVA